MPHFPVLASGGSCVCGTLTDGEVGLGPSSSRPVAVRPRLGLGLLRRPGRCCRSPARCLAGFSSLGWLAGCSPGSYLSVSSSWSLCRVPRVLRLSSPGRRVVFSEAGMAVRALLLATSLPWFFSSLCGALRAPPDIWPRASVSLLAFGLLLAWSLRLWGDPCLGVQWLSFRV